MIVIVIVSSSSVAWRRLGHAWTGTIVVTSCAQWRIIRTSNSDLVAICTYTCAANSELVSLVLDGIIDGFESLLLVLSCSRLW